MSEFVKNFVKEGIVNKEDFHVYSDLMDCFSEIV